MTHSRSNHLHKFSFYSRGLLEYFLIPDTYFRQRLDLKFRSINPSNREYIVRRVSYYNRIVKPSNLPDQACKFSKLPLRKKTGYYIDYQKLMRHFPSSVKTAQRFGDVKTICKVPQFVKTRPIDGDNENNILLKLNSVRHFRPIYDPTSYRDKKDSLVWRGKVKRDHRRIVFEKHFHHPLCDLGKTNVLEYDEMSSWNKPYMSINDQLRYKFILSIEGNEVATNLKWIAQSNSLCFMTKPKFESWFMEGTLKAGVHYVELRDDYADLPEKIDYYLKKPAEAERIIANLQNHYDLFRDEKTEELIGLLVILKYLSLTDQLPPDLSKICDYHLFPLIGEQANS